MCGEDVCVCVCGRCACGGVGVCVYQGGEWERDSMVEQDKKH